MHLSTPATENLEGRQILVTGGTGFIGAPLCQALLASGAQVSVLTRDRQHAQQRLPAQVKCVEQLQALSPENIWAVINLAGAGIMDRRWSQSRRQLLLSSRIGTTQQLLHFFADAAPEVVISGSAIGYYGETGDQVCDESASSGEGFAPYLCAEWERAAQAFATRGSRLCWLRTGIVLGEEGGALGRMLPAFKLGLGGPMGSGQQWMSWIHRADIVGLILWLLNDTTLAGPVNATAPESVRNRDFARTLGRVLKRPAVLPVPAFVLKLLLGQAAEELLLSSNRVAPKKIQQAGYTFQYPQLEAALRACV